MSLYSVAWIVQNATFNTSSGNYMGTGVGTPSIVADMFGNSYVTYYTTGKASGQTQTGGQDIVIFRLNSSGILMWITQQPIFDTVSNDLNPVITLGSTGNNVYIAYQTAGQASGQTHTNPGYDISVLNLNTSSGIVQWVAQQLMFNTLGNGTSIDPSITTDIQNNVYVSYIGGTPYNYSVVAFELNKSGILIWTYKQTVATNSIDPSSIVVDWNGNSTIAYACGNSSGNTVIVTRLNNGGDLVWTTSSGSVFNTTGTNNYPCLANDSTGNLYLTYQTNGVASGQTNTGGTDLVICRLNRQGQMQWIRQNATFNTIANETYPSLVTDRQGALYLAYQTTGRVSGQTLTGTSDLVILKLNTSGDTVWVTQSPIIDTGTDQNTSLSVNLEGEVFATYQTNSFISGLVTSVSNPDVVVLRLHQTVPSTSPPYVVSWIRQQTSFNTSSPDLDPVIAIDNSGNSYVAYSTTGRAPGQTIVGIDDIVVFKMNTSGQLQWIAQNSSFDTISQDGRPAIAVDTNGNSYITYATDGTISGGTGLSLTTEIAVFKLNSNGQTLWTVQNFGLNTVYGNWSPSIALDTSGTGDMNFYIAFVTLNASPARNEIVVTKLTTNSGVVLWRNRQLVSSGSTGQNPSICVDLQGNTYTCFAVNGYISGQTPVGGSDLVTFKLDSSGLVQWTIQNTVIDTTLNEGVPSIVTDSSGSLYMVYQTTGVLPGQTQTGNPDIVVMKLYTDTGSIQWVTQQPTFNTTASNNSHVINIGKDGFIYIGYYTNGVASGQTQTGGQDVVLLAFNQYGDLQWVQQQPTFNTAGNDTVPTIAIDSLSNLYATYQTTGVTSGQTSTGSTDVVVMRMSPTARLNITSYTGTVPLIAVGQPVQYTATVTNTGSTTITNLVMSDNIGSINATSSSLGIGASFTAYGHVFLTQAMIDYGQLTSQVIAMGQYSSYTIQTQTTLTVSTQLEYPLTLNTYTVNGSGQSFLLGASMLCSFNITNNSIYTINNVYGSNTLGDTTATLANVSPHTTQSLTCVHTLTAGDITAGNVVSSGTAFGSGYQSNTIYNLYTQLPLNATTVAFPPVSYTGTSVTYTYYFQNLSPNTIDVTCYDSLGMVVTVSGVTAGSSGQVSAGYQLTGGNASDGYVTSTAYVIGLFASGHINSAPLTTTVGVPPPFGWVIQQPSFNTTGSDQTPKIALDSSGFVYVTYSTDGQVSGQSLVGGFDIAVVKLTNSGSVIWVRQQASFDTTGNDLFPSIAVDVQGNSYISYQTNGVASGQTLNGTQNIVVFKLDTNGNTIWVAQQPSFNLPDNNSTPSIALDPSGNPCCVYVTSSAVVVFKLDASGNTLWEQSNTSFSVMGINTSPSIACDAFGNIYVAYSTNGVVSSQSSTGLTDIVVCKITSSGQTLWVSQKSSFNTTSNDVAPSIAIDSSGYPYIAYQTTGTATYQFNGSGKISYDPRYLYVVSTFYNDEYAIIQIADGSWTSTSTPYNTGGSDIVLFKLNQTTGTTMWVTQTSFFNATSNNMSPQIAIGSKYLHLVYQTDGDALGQYNVGGSDIVSVILDLNGLPLNVQQNPLFDTTLNDTVPSVAVDVSGNTYIVYQTLGTSLQQTHTGGSDIVISQLRFPPIGITFLSYYCDLLPGTNVTVGTTITYHYQIKNTGQATLIHGLIYSNGYFVATFTQITPNSTITGTFNLLVTANDIKAGQLNNQCEVYGFYLSYMAVDYASNVINITTVNLRWILQQPSFNTTGIETDPQITLDSSGFLYVTYATNGTVSGQTSTGDYDIVVMKLTNSGVVQWVAQQPTFNTTNLDSTPSIGHDQNGNTYVGYYTQGVTPGQTMTGSKGNVAVFKLNSSGLCQWVIQQPTFNRDTDNVDPSVVVDTSGNTYVTYCANGTQSPEQYESPPLLEITYTSSSYTSMSMVAGDSHWQSFVPFEDRKLKQYGGYIDCSSGQFYYTIYRGQSTSGIIIDTSSIIGPITSGYQWQIATIGTPADLYRYQYYTLQVTCTSGTIDWANSSYPQEIYPNGRSDVALQTSFWFEIYTTQLIADLVTFKLSTSGTLLWMVEQPPLYSGGQFAPSMVIDSSGCSYIAFYTDGTTSGQTNTGGYDIAVIKLDASGVFQWASQRATFNTASDDVTPSLACDPSGNLVVAYQTNGVASGQTVTGSTDIVVFKLNSSGTTQWVSQQPTFNATGYNTEPSIAFGPSGFIYVVYQTTGEVSGQVSTGGIDVVYVVFDGSGGVHHASQNRFNTTGDDTQPDLVVDNNGISYVVYKTNGQAMGQTLTGQDDLVIFSVVPYIPIIDFASYSHVLPPNPTIGTQITYTYDIVNIGNVSVTCSVLDLATTITLGNIPVGGSATATNVYNLIQDDFDLGYVATQAVATAIYQLQMVTTQASLTVNLPQVSARPYISDYQGVVIYGGYPGAPIEYYYEITNSGNVTLSSGVITDNIGTPALDIGNIPSGISNYISTHFLTQEEINQGSITSQAVVSGRFGAQRFISLTATTTVTIAWDLQLYINVNNVDFIPSGMVVQPGTHVVYTYYIENYCNVPLSNCYFIDQTGQVLLLNTQVPFNGGYITSPNAYLVTQADIIAGQLTITAAVGGFWGVTEVTATTNSTIPITAVCQMEVFYYGQITTYPVVYGTPVTYYISVQNTGNVPLSPTLISDTLGYSTTVTTPIDVGQDHDITFTYLVTSGDLVNGNIASTATSSGEYTPLGLYADAQAQSYVSFSPVTQPLSLRWLQQQPTFNTIGSDIIPSITVDNSGNVYVAYMTDSVASGQTLTGGPYNIVVFKIQHQPNDQWSLQWITEQPSFNTDVNNVLPSIVADADGNAYVAYCGNGVASGQTNKGEYDIVVFKLDTNGQVVWVIQQEDFNTDMADISPTIALDQNGDIHVSYMTRGTIPGGESYIHSDDMLRFGRDALYSYYIVNNSQSIWQSFTATSDSPMISYGFESVIDYGQLRINLYIGSGVGGTLIDTQISPVMPSDWYMFTPSGGHYIITSGQIYTIEVAALTPSGPYAAQCQWYITGSGPYSGGTNNINPSQTMTFAVVIQQPIYYNVATFAVDTDGYLLWVTQLMSFNTQIDNILPVTVVDFDSNTYVAYYTKGKVNSSGSTVDDSIVVFKIDPYGDLVWTKQQKIFNTTGDDVLPSIGVDPTGNVYIAYQTNGYASGQTLTGVYDIVVFKLNSNGQLLWIRQQSTFNTTQSNIQPRLTVDHIGNVYITFSTDGTCSGQTNLGGNDVVIVKFDANGDVKWVTQQPSFNTTTNDTYPVITVDPLKNLYVAYQTTGTASNQTNCGSSDIVVFMLSPFDLAVTVDTYEGSVTDYTNRIVTYTYQLTNTGVQVLTNVIIHDTLNGTFSVGTINPDQTVTKTKLYQLTVSNIVNGSVSNQMYITANSLTTATTSITTILPPMIPIQTWVQAYTTNGENTNPKITYAQDLYLSYMTTGVLYGQVMTGNTDLALLKLDTDGTQQWITQTGSFNTPQVNQLPAIAGDSSGNLCLAYQTAGTMYPLVNLDGYQQVIVARFNSQGQTRLLEQPELQSEGYNNMTPTIAVDSDGSSYLAYIGDSQVYVVTVNSSGQVQWGPTVIDGPTCWTPSIAVDSSANSYIAYSMDTLTGAVISVAKLDSSGVAIWPAPVVVSDAEGNSINPAITVDTSGNTYIVFQTEIGVSEWDIVVTNVNTSGVILWNSQQDTFNTHTMSEVPQITLDTSGTMIVCYSTDGRLGYPYFGGNTQAIIVFRLDINGTWKWTLQNSVYRSEYFSDSSLPTITSDHQRGLYIAKEMVDYNGYGDPGNRYVVSYNLSYPSITMATSGSIASSGYIYTYTIGNPGQNDIDSVTINDSLGASGLLGTIVPTGSVTVTFIHVVSSGTTSTATAIGVFKPCYISLGLPASFLPYYISSQQTITI